MRKKMRKTGIDILGDVAWGSHFCQFYKTKEDLIDILGPYFKAGLENNEFCMWVTSEPLSQKEAKKAMRMAIPNFDRYLKRGQIKIVPLEEWYLKEGTFNLQRVLNAWVEKLNTALAQNYDGMRVTGNTAWLEKRDWRDFADYEEEINNAMGKYKMLAICSYPLDKCGASEVIDVVGNHQSALIRRTGKWELIESSEHKRMEKALQESELRFRTSVENMLDCYGIYSAIRDKSGHIVDFRIDYVNEAACLSNHMTKEEQIGKRLLELLPAHRETGLFDEYCHLVETGKPLKKESVIYGDFYKKQRLIRAFDIRAVRLGDGFAVAWRDITERKQMEEVLKESEKKYRTLFDNMLEGFAYCKIIVDKNNKPVDFVYIEVNDAFETLTGLKKELVTGKRVTEAIPGIKKAHPDLFKIYGKVALTGKSTHFDIYFEPLKIWLSISVYCPQKGYFVAVFDNITERKRAEEKLKEYSEHLEEMVEERTKELSGAQEELVRKEKLATLGQLAGGMSHELRNPLGVISNSVYYLNMKLKDADEKTLKHLSILKREVERANTIITDLLDFSRSKLPSLEEGDANDIVKNALVNIEIPENISVETRLDKNLPKILLDPDQIQQVFQNIISNAVQAMREGGKLRIETGTKGEFAEIMFEDTGEGIAEENFAKIFEPLYTTRAKGIGLGLTIVKSLVDGHKGRIEVKSEVGKGTTITIKLPQREEGRVK